MRFDFKCELLLRAIFKPKVRFFVKEKYLSIKPLANIFAETVLKDFNKKL